MIIKYDFKKFTIPLLIQDTGNVACARSTSEPTRSSSNTENLKNEHSTFVISNCALIGFWYHIGNNPLRKLTFVRTFLSIELLLKVSLSLINSISMNGLEAFLSSSNFGKQCAKIGFKKNI